VLVYLVFEHTEQTRALLDQVQPDITPESEPVWKKVWDCIQPGSTPMWLFDACCAGSGKYIRHMLASKKLADRFEEGGEVDDSMYIEIVR